MVLYEQAGRKWLAYFNNSTASGVGDHFHYQPTYGTIRFESEGEYLFASNVPLDDWQSPATLASAFERAEPLSWEEKALLESTYRAIHGPNSDFSQFERLLSQIVPEIIRARSERRSPNIDAAITYYPATGFQIRVVDSNEKTSDESA